MDHQPLGRPADEVAGAVALSLAAIHPDRATAGESWVATLGWTFSRGPEGSRAVLSTIAGSMMTITSVAFSITVVAPQLASSQFGPRLLRNFMRDRINQVALGTFIATFTYCLLALRTVNGTGGPEIRPERLLAGAGAGGLAGGLIRALVGWGMPRDRAKTYEAGIQQGGAVLGVKPRSDEDADYLQNEWKRHSGEHVYR